MVNIVLNMVFVKTETSSQETNELIIMTKKIPSNTTSFIMIKVATCFDPIGSSSGLHYEPTFRTAAYIFRIPNNVYKE
jgi:hypothetical protein